MLIFVLNDQPDVPVARLNWTYNLTDEDGFQMQRTTDTGSIPFANYFTTSHGITQSYDTNIFYNNTYWYRVYAFNKGGNSSFSNVASVSLQRSTILEFVTSPLDQAIYHPSRNSIFAVRGGTIFEYSLALTELSHSQYDPSGMSPATLCYEPNLDLIYATCWNNPAFGISGSNVEFAEITQDRFIYSINPSTLEFTGSINLYTSSFGVNTPQYAQRSKGVMALMYKKEVGAIYFSANMNDSYSFPFLNKFVAPTPNGISWYSAGIGQGGGPTDFDVDFFSPPGGTIRTTIPSDAYQNTFPSKFYDNTSSYSSLSGSFLIVSGSMTYISGTMVNITGSADGFPNINYALFTGSFANFTGSTGGTSYPTASFIGTATGFTGYFYGLYATITTYGAHDIFWAAWQELGSLWGQDAGIVFSHLYDPTFYNYQPMGVAVHPSGSLWVSNVADKHWGGTIIRFDITNVSPYQEGAQHTASLSTIIDLGRPNFVGLHLRYNPYDGKIYAPGYSDNTVIVIDESDNSFVIKTGFDLPLDVVFTPTHKFAVQHGDIGLKEII